MKIKIAPYDFNWATQFQEEKSELAQLLNKSNPTIEHVGSTSINDIGAQPIIDIMIGFAREEELDKCVPLLVEAGYVYVRKFEKTK